MFLQIVGHIVHIESSKMPTQLGSFQHAGNVLEIEERDAQ